MQQREKNLGIAVAGLLAVVVGWFVYSSVSATFSTRQVQLESLQTQLKKNQTKLDNYRKQQKHLAELQRLSLPVDHDLARSLYANWLLQKVSAAGMTNLEVTPLAAQYYKDNFDKNTFAINARGTLESVTKLLYEFYQGDHLHKIHVLNIKPNDNGKDLSLQMSVEALSIVGAPRKETLNTSVSPRLAEKDFAKYKDAIVTRNLFAAYVAPKPPRQEPPVVRVDPPKQPDPPPSFDPAKFAKVTAILTSKSGPEAWLLVQTTGKLLKLKEGDSFEVGNIHGQVIRIDLNSMEYSTDGRRKTVPVGKSLRESTEEPVTDERATNERALDME